MNCRISGHAASDNQVLVFLHRSILISDVSLFFPLVILLSIRREGVSLHASFDEQFPGLIQTILMHVHNDPLKIGLRPIPSFQDRGLIQGKSSKFKLANSFRYSRISDVDVKKTLQRK